MGALVLDPVTFEDVEADRQSGSQAALVVVMACLAGGFAAVGSSSMTPATFALGMAVTLGAWVVGFAAAPGIFLAFGAMRSAAPFAFAVASIWMIAATGLAVRQALDYRSLGRAVFVCVTAWLLTFGITAATGMLLARPVS